ncbi:MAG TPA: hypothetical protein VLX92_19545 [Kofleriaceae bacterium]|nr:hypothetical protein [Kofleriaceae bacterium]
MRRLAVWWLCAACGGAPAHPTTPPPADDDAACQAGNAERCIAAAHAHGDPTRRGYDPARVVVLYRRGCELASDRACMLLANEQVLGTPAEIQTGIATLDRLCTKGFVDACTNLATLLLNGSFVARDVSRGIALLERGCDGGDEYACESYAFDIVRRLAPDPAAPLPADCDDAKPASCLLLGARVLVGSGTAQDAARAAALFDRACGKKYASGCLFLGMTYVAGTPPDLARGIAAFRTGCDGNDALACNELAVAYETGKGVAIDRTRAVALYTKACDAGALPSCNNVASLYFTGDGVSKDLARATAYMTRACSGGIATACNDAGIFYAIGSGVAKDDKRALELLDAACKGGDDSGCKNRQLVVKCNGGDMVACTAFEHMKIVP